MLDTIEEKDEKTSDEIENLESEEVTEETEVLQNDAVNGDGIYMALSDGPLNYVNVINLVAPEVGGSHFGFLVTLVAVLLTIGCYVIGYTSMEGVVVMWFQMQLWKGCNLLKGRVVLLPW